MLDRPQSQALRAFWTSEREAMTVGGNPEQDRARRFRDAALPHLDEVFTLARYLLRNPADAEDAVQECYLRALRHFDSYRGPAMKPWLFAILRNVCKVEFAQRNRPDAAAGGGETETAAETPPLWQEDPASPEAALIRVDENGFIRRLIEALPQPFRETIVLREVNDLSYQQIAEVTGVPVGTVMSRLARARSMLQSAWQAAEGTTP